MLAWFSLLLRACLNQGMILIYKQFNLRNAKKWNKPNHVHQAFVNPAI